MSYILIDRKATRTEFADSDVAENRFIHNNERKSRRLGAYNQPLFVNNFTVLRNKDMADDGAKVPLLGLTSAKLTISSASREEALDAWTKLKTDVDQIFDEQHQVFKGLPLTANFDINA